MSKARARERAKVRAGKKQKKRTDIGKLDQQNNHEQFNHQNYTIKGPSGNANTAGSGTAKRGAARSG
tara:strand:+ start:267 stop:467 length:201 start_codon:yes stop_codon:yes gene_type:complete